MSHSLGPIDDSYLMYNENLTNKSHQQLQQHQSHNRLGKSSSDNLKYIFYIHLNLKKNFNYF